MATNLKACIILWELSITTFEEIFMMLAIGLFLYDGNGETWSFNIEGLLIAYMAVRGTIFALKILALILIEGTTKMGKIVILSTRIIWVIGMAAYFIAAMVYFFGKDEDCMDNATNYWVALLIIVIEGFVFFFYITVYRILIALILKKERKRVKERIQRE